MNTILFISLILAIVGWLLPLIINTLNREQRARADQRGLSRFLFRSAGLVMGVLYLLGTN